MAASPAHALLQPPDDVVAVSVSCRACLERHIPDVRRTVFRDDAATDERVGVYHRSGRYEESIAFRDNPFVDPT